MAETALVVQDDGSELRCEITPTGLTLPSTLSFTQWARLGRALGRLGNGVQWATGDWVGRGEQYGEEYTQIVNDIGYKPQSLLNMAWVARRFPPSRRREKLSWGHHATVAAMEPPVADKWLEMSERNEWTVAELRRGIRALKPGDQDETPTCCGCPIHCPHDVEE